MSKGSRIPCPFVYANGRQCNGHVERVEAYKADVVWFQQPDGTWAVQIGFPRSHYHVFCSEKGNHAGWKRPDSDQMKFYLDTLPDELRKAMSDAEK